MCAPDSVHRLQTDSDLSYSITLSAAQTMAHLDKALHGMCLVGTRLGGLGHRL